MSSRDEWGFDWLPQFLAARGYAVIQPQFRGSAGFGDKWLNDNGVDAKTHYSIAIHKQAGYPWGKNARTVGSLKNAEYNADACISLPMFPELRDDEVDYVNAKVLEWDKLQG